MRGGGGGGEGEGGGGGGGGGGDGGGSWENKLAGNGVCFGLDQLCQLVEVRS